MNQLSVIVRTDSVTGEVTFIGSPFPTIEEAIAGVTDILSMTGSVPKDPAKPSDVNGLVWSTLNSTSWKQERVVVTKIPDGLFFSGSTTREWFPIATYSIVPLGTQFVEEVKKKITAEVLAVTDHDDEKDDNDDDDDMPELVENFEAVIASQAARIKTTLLAEVKSAQVPNTTPLAEVKTAQPTSALEAYQTYSAALLQDFPLLSVDPALALTYFKGSKRWQHSTFHDWARLPISKEQWPAYVKSIQYQDGSQSVKYGEWSLSTEVGSDVEVRCRQTEKWFRGVILASRPHLGEVYIHFSNYSSSYDDWFPLHSKWLVPRGTCVPWLLNVGHPDNVASLSKYLTVIDSPKTTTTAVESNTVVAQPPPPANTLPPPSALHDVD